MEPTGGDSPLHTKTFPGLLESLASIAEFVTRAAEAAGLTPKAIYEVQMAVDEACANIIEHGNCGLNPGDIHCGCRVTASGLTVILADHALPFKPRRIPTPKMRTLLEDRKAGGLGLYLMHRVMDEVRFDCDNSSDQSFHDNNHAHNLLILVKHK
jgi:anti-sigma regulatory factor (Ser/Thr protein kinase)